MEPIVTSEDFRARVEHFSEAHATLQAANTELKVVRKTAKGMQASILAYMQAHGIDECALGHCRLVRKQKTRTEPLKKEHVEGELRRHMPSGVDEAVANMYNNRSTRVEDILTVVTPEAHKGT